MISDFTQASSELYISNSQIESDRFGMTVARLNISTRHDASDQQVVEICQNSESNLLILRYPTSRVMLAQKLAEIKRLVVYQADTLVYFAKDIASSNTKIEPSHDWQFREAQSSDNADLVRLSKIIFEEYPSHYRANEMLNSDAIRDDTDLAARRLGCVWPMRPLIPRPKSRHILGSCVVLPEPVSPHKITTW